MTMVSDVHHLMGPAEIAEYLGVSRQRVSQLMAKPSFPRPAAELAQGKVWHSDEIAAWQERRRTVGPLRGQSAPRTDD